MTINNAHITEAEKGLFRWWVEKVYTKTNKFNDDSNSSKMKHLFESIFGHYVYEESIVLLMEEWGYASKSLGGAHCVFKLRFRDESMRHYSGDYRDAEKFGALLCRYKNEHDDTVE